jgi:hypothetical protein
MTLNANVNRDKKKDIFVYDTLHLKPIPPPISNEPTSNPITDVRHLSDAIHKEMKTHYFSTYPYYVNHESSKQAIRSHQSGNCIALSYGLQDTLKQNGYNAFLIPASVPKKYRMEDYSEFPISHVAVCVVISDSRQYILDPAFYFVSPLEVKVGSSTKIVDLYNPLSHEKHFPILKDVICRDVRKETIYNDSRKIEYDLVSVSYNDNTANDMWDYHLVNILNPDSSIGLKYLHMKKAAFLCILDKHLVMTCMIKQKIPGGITLIENGKYNTYDKVNSIPEETKKRFSDIYGMKKYLSWSDCEKFEEMYDDENSFDKLRLEFKGGGKRQRRNKSNQMNKTKKKKRYF